VDINEVTRNGPTSLASRGLLDPVCLRADEKRNLCVSALEECQLREGRVSAEITSMVERGIDNPTGLSWGETRTICAAVLAHARAAPRDPHETYDLVTAIAAE